MDKLSKDTPIRPAQPEEKIYFGIPFINHDYFCPTCDAHLASYADGDKKEGYERCWLCGQKINWNKERVIINVTICD